MRNEFPILSKIRMAGIILLMTILAGCSSDLMAKSSNVENIRKINDKFEFRLLALESKSSWEGVSHFEFIFYQGKMLVQSSVAGVSPSGQFLGYVDEKSGHVYVFDTKTNQNKKVSEIAIGPIEKLEWSLDEHTLKAISGNGLILKEYSF